jgi:hypothetical protein
MDQTNSNAQPVVPAANLPSGTELRYYYFGFYKALKRYRVMTIVGWLVVAIGCASFPMGWSVGRSSGLIEIALSCATVVAGLGLVSQSVSSLEAYLRIVLPFDRNGEQHPMVYEVAEIMKDVDEGGWQEAYAAIERVERLQEQHGLPPLG